MERNHYEKAEKKESIADVRGMQIEAKEDWSEAQRNNPIIAKIIAAKEEDKRPITYSAKVLLQKYIGHYGTVYG